MSALQPEEPDRANDHPSRRTSVVILVFGWLVDPAAHLWVLEQKFATRFGNAWPKFRDDRIARLRGVWQGIRNIGRLGGRIG